MTVTTLIAIHDTLKAKRDEAHRQYCIARDDYEEFANSATTPKPLLKLKLALKEERWNEYIAAARPLEEFEAHEWH